MASADGGSVPNAVGYGEGCPLSSRLGVWESVVSSPSGVRSQSPGRKRVLAYFEGHRTLFLYIYDKNLRGIICISVSYSIFFLGGGLVPCVPPVIYAHAQSTRVVISGPERGRPHQPFFF